MKFLLIIMNLLLVLNIWSSKLDNKKFIKAVYNNDMNKINFFLNKGIDINTRDKDGHTALIIASAKGYMKLTELLIEKGADINAINYYGKTALMYAYLKGNTDILKFLIKSGAELNIKDNSGKTLLMDVCNKKDMDMFKYLVKNGAILNIRDKNNKTVLDYLNYKEKNKILEFYSSEFDEGAESEIKLIQDNIKTYEYTIFEYVKNNDLKNVKRVIEEKININILDKKGCNPIYYALLNENQAIFNFLLENNADLNTIYNNEKTLLDLARDEYQTKFIKILKKNGAKSYIRIQNENVIPEEVFVFIEKYFSAIINGNFEDLIEFFTLDAFENFEEKEELISKNRKFAKKFGTLEDYYILYIDIQTSIIPGKKSKVWIIYSCNYENTINHQEIEIIINKKNECKITDYWIIDSFFD